MSQQQNDGRKPVANDNRGAFVANDNHIIPVRKLVFNLPPFDIPGKDSAGGVDCDPTKELRKYEAHYIPSMRHHRIVYTSHIKGAPPEVVFVHESRVSAWYPMVAP